MNDHDLNTILDIGISLSSEKDLNRLLEKILSKVMELTHCDAGTLYLLDNDVLKFKIMRNDTMKTYEGGDGKDPKLPPVKLSRENVCSFSLLEGRTVCIADVRDCAEYDFSGPIRYDSMTGYRTRSMLVVPMMNRVGEKLGVVQLINAMDNNNEVCEFSEELIHVVESIASQAAVTIQNVRYIEDIRGLFDSLVKLMSSAVDARTPYNGAHTRHMAEYGERFIDYLNKAYKKDNGEIRFQPEHKDALLMSIWLHDIGKIVIPLEVMNKEKRLSKLQELTLKNRLERIRFLTEIRRLRGECNDEEAKEIGKRLLEVGKLTEDINRSDFLTEERLKALNAAGDLTYIEEDGTEKLWISKEEKEVLSIRKGTLTDEERKVMESHVVVTDEFLSKIKFSSQLSSVRTWAASHHEFINGSGYPKGLSGDQIPIETRIITILDIFDALVATDRPYKKGMQIDTALSILKKMADTEGKLDPVLTQLFTESRCWEKEEVEQ